jgi:hypothetical protein
LKKDDQNSPLELDNSDGQYLLPIPVIAQLLGISTKSLQTWMRKPNPPPMRNNHKIGATDLGQYIREKQTVRKGGGGSYPYLPPGVVMASDLKMPKASGGDGEKSFDKERTRKESAAADKIEMENAITRGEFIRAEDVEAAWATILGRVKTRMLRVPSVAAQVLVGEEDMVKIQEVLDDFVRDALTEASVDWREGSTEDENAV